jgi:predicted lipoprotein with Yx(FWY)xxD motif
MKWIGTSKAGIAASLAVGLTLAGTAVGVSTAVAGTHHSDRAAQSMTVAVHPSRYGKILFDGRGRVLYLFGRDRGGRSSCSGACAKAWPPVLTTAAPKAGAGIRSSLLTTTRRTDGTAQVSYAGHPLYYYQGDTKPGQIKCQGASNFGGLWLVVAPTGKAVR